MLQAWVQQPISLRLKQLYQRPFLNAGALSVAREKRQNSALK